MKDKRKNQLEEEMNRGVWEASSDELRRIQIDLYQKGLSDGKSLPKGIKRISFFGMWFGKLVGMAALLGAGYALLNLGGWLAQVTRALF